ncbi:MAG TPA: Crp/Fnr family transcriptional regulator [Chloroflexota bacterium]
MVATPARVSTWYIRHVNVFRPLDGIDAGSLARATTPRHFPRGELIVTADTRPELVCVVHIGTVRVFHRAADGSETTVERLESGHLFGVTGFLGADPGGLLVQAETDVDVGMVEAHRFLGIVAHWPAALLELALRLGVRIRDGEQQLGRLTATGARARLAGTLHRLARDSSDTQPGGGLRLRAVPRHSDLATEIGATRETVTRMLARLEQDGYIRRFGRQIVLPDPARLVEDFDLSSEADATA